MSDRSRWWQRRQKIVLHPGFAQLDETVAESPHDYVPEIVDRRKVRLHFRIVLNGSVPSIAERHRRYQDIWRKKRLGGRGEVVDAFAVIEIGPAEDPVFTAHLYVRGEYMFDDGISNGSLYGSETASRALSSLERVIEQVTLPIYGKAIDRRMMMQRWDAEFRALSGTAPRLRRLVRAA